jgi:Na+/H+ antiporter NhaB
LGLKLSDIDRLGQSFALWISSLASGGVLILEAVVIDLISSEKVMKKCTA